MLEAFVPVVILLALGVMLARAKVMPERSAEALNQVVIWVCLPAAILIHVPESLHGSIAMLWLAAIPWALASVMFALVRMLRFDRATEGALLMTAALGNTSFLGYPVVRALYGQDALAHAIVFDQLGSFLLLATYGSVVTARYGSRSARLGAPSAAEGPPPAGAQGRTERAEPIDLLRPIVRFPPFIALLAALALGLSQTSIPTLLLGPLELCAEAMLPLVLLALGLGLELKVPAEIRRPLALGLGLKLVLGPALVFVTLWVAGIDGQLARVALIESAMPPMVTAGVLAAGAGLSPRLSIAMTGLGLVASLITLPLWHWLGSLVL